jgi:hypothetical protein
LGKKTKEPRKGKNGSKAEFAAILGSKELSAA